MRLAFGKANHSSQRERAILQKEVQSPRTCTVIGWEPRGGIPRASMRKAAEGGPPSPRNSAIEIRERLHARLFNLPSNHQEYGMSKAKRIGIFCLPLALAASLATAAAWDSCAQ